MPKFKVKGVIVVDGKRYEGTTQKPGEIDLPSNVFFLTAPRYINGEYIQAAPEAPAKITLPEGSFIDSGLRPDEPELPKPHYVPGRSSNAPSAAEHFGGEKKGQKSGRAADKEPI